jgi:hypothetical protein
MELLKLTLLMELLELRFGYFEERLAPKKINKLRIKDVSAQKNKI